MKIKIQDNNNNSNNENRDSNVYFSLCTHTNLGISFSSSLLLWQQHLPQHDSVQIQTVFQTKEDAVMRWLALLPPSTKVVCLNSHGNCTSKTTFYVFMEEEQLWWRSDQKSACFGFISSFFFFLIQQCYFSNICRECILTIKRDVIFYLSGVVFRFAGAK